MRRRKSHKEHRSKIKDQIDQRAPALVAEGRDADDILTPRQLAAWLDVHEAWLETARARGTGPAYVKFGMLTRYRRSDVLAWLQGRIQLRTSEKVRD
jgi:predicted DNA-binding transcriptional regulator AlpA